MFQFRQVILPCQARALRLLRLAALMLPIVAGEAGAASAQTSGADVLPLRRPIEHGRQHQPSQREIEVDRTAVGNPRSPASAEASDARTLDMLYAEVMRRSAPPSAAAEPSALRPGLTISLSPVMGPREIGAGLAESSH
jgi:hypothetical protein